LEKLPSIASALDEEMRRGTTKLRAAQGLPALPSHGPWTPDHELTGTSLFRAAFVALAAIPDIVGMMTAWRENAATLGWGTAFEVWVDKASSYRSINLESARAIMDAPQYFPDEEHLLVLVRIVSDERASPSVAIDACINLVVWTARSMWRTAIAPATTALTEKTWRRFIASPAMFPPSAPATQMLRAACEAPLIGLAKAAKIILAACGALRKPLDARVRSLLEHSVAETLALIKVESPFPTLGEAREQQSS
jgi:hypothetical protein